MALVEDYIAQIDGLLADYNDAIAEGLIKDIVSVFADAIPGIKKGLDRYRGRAIAVGTVVTYDNRGDLRKLRGKLELHRESVGPRNQKTQGEEYFNLVVRANPSIPMLESRMLEGVSDNISMAFRRNDRYDLDALAKLPTILTPEFADDDRVTQAILGFMESPSLDPVIRNPVMAFPSRCLLEKGCLGSWGNRRTRWIVLEGNPFRIFADCAIIPQVGSSFHQAVPDGSEVAVDECLAAVMMPFKHEPELDNVYRAIASACQDAGFHSVRVDELATPTDITNDIRNLICGAGVVVADISGKNPNVMFELGFARGKGKPVVLVSSDDLGSLPFDIRQQRVLTYAESTIGLKELTARLADSLQTLTK